jgi:8-oxo-dGTP pyrophosphatase MutT (NUDIX family)
MARTAWDELLATTTDILYEGEDVRVIQSVWGKAAFDVPREERVSADAMWSVVSRAGMYNRPGNDSPGLVGCVEATLKDSGLRLVVRPTWMYSVYATNYIEEAQRTFSELAITMESWPTNWLERLPYDARVFERELANPITVDIVVVHLETKSILAQRRGPRTLDGSRYMASAGGFCEPSDEIGGQFDPRATATRETWEETGLHFEAADLIPLIFHRTPRDRFVHFSYYALVDEQSSRLHTTADHAEVGGYAWIPFDEILALARDSGPSAAATMFATMRELGV